MKKLQLISVFCFTFFLFVNAQNKKGKMDDVGRIAITSYVPELGKMPKSARSLLTKKLSALVSKNGMGGTSIDSRFIITADIEEISKDITPTAPPMFAYNFQVDIYIADFKSKKLYGQETFTMKAVGTNETKAYIAGVKQIKPSNKNLVLFVEASKTKIIEYYNSQCDFILKKANSLADLDKTDEAIATLMTIPEVCKKCYEKALDATKPIYKKHIDKECKSNLQNAKNAWNANQNSEGAQDAAIYLAFIDPNADCYDEAEKFSEEIRLAIKKLDDRDWDFKMKVYEDELALAQKALDLESKRIESSIEISKNYAEAYTATEKYKIDVMKSITTSYLASKKSGKEEINLDWLLK